MRLLVRLAEERPAKSYQQKAARPSRARLRLYFHVNLLQQGSFAEYCRCKCSELSAQLQTLAFRARVVSRLNMPRIKPKKSILYTYGRGRGFFLRPFCRSRNAFRLSSEIYRLRSTGPMDVSHPFRRYIDSVLCETLRSVQTSS